MSDQETIRTVVNRIALDVLLPNASERGEKNIFNHDGIVALGKSGIMGMVLPY